MSKHYTQSCGAGAGSQSRGSRPFWWKQEPEPEPYFSWRLPALCKIHSFFHICLSFTIKYGQKLGYHSFITVLIVKYVQLDPLVLAFELTCINKKHILQVFFF